MASASKCLCRLLVWRQALTQRLVAGLKEFRTMAVPNFRASNRLILPPTLRLLPLWIFGALSGKPDISGHSNVDMRTG